MSTALYRYAFTLAITAGEAASVYGQTTSTQSVGQTPAGASLQQEVLGWVPDATIVFVAGFFLLAVIATVKSLKKSPGWSLADTLSEKTVPAAPNAQARANGLATGSTSRLVTFLGLIGMLSMFLGFGFYALWASFNGRSGLKDELDAAGHYLLYGSALFAPYAFNQLKAAFGQ
jgi:hypothetical protein